MARGKGRSGAGQDGTRRARVLRGLGTAVVVVLVALVPLRLWVAEPLHVVTGSMTPTLRPGEHVLAWKLGAHGTHWHRGDVVSIRQDGADPLVKRIVALGGDRVGIRDGRLVVDGHVVHEDYADPQRIDSVFFGPVDVPAGHVFVLGDDRRNSRDSRVFGAVPVDDVEGRVVAVVWPLTALAGVSR